jgi:predicted dehydrogenase
VVVDKPFTVSTAQADELIALAGEADRLLTVFHNRRWDSDFLTLKSVLQQGCLGTLHRYEQRWERFRPSPKGGWREAEGAGSGVLYDLGSHMLDQALLLFGQPRALFCHLQTQREGTDAVDCFDLILDYGAMQAFLSSNCLSAAPSFRYLVMGEGGSFRKDGLDPQEDALAAGARPAGPGWGEEPEKLWGHLDLLRQGQLERQPVATVAGNYPEFYRNLAMAARGQASLAVGAHQARDVVFALELALASHREGAWRPWSSGPL